MEEKPKKSNRIYLIIIVVLALALIGTGGYLMYDKMNEKEEPTKTQEKEKDTEEENLSLDDARFYSIYQTLNPYTKIQTRANGFQSFTASEMIHIILNDFKLSDFVKTEELTQWGDPYYSLSEETILTYLKKYFPKDVSINANELINENFVVIQYDAFENTGGMLSFIDYDANTKNYKVRFSGTGSGSGPIENVTTSKITSAILKDDIITVKEQVIFYTYTHIIENQQLIYQIYSDEAKTNLIDTKTFEDGTVSSIDIDIDDYNQTSTNTYTFKKDNNGNYYFAGNIIE